MKPLSDTQKLIFAMAFMFLVMGFVTGPDDYRHAKMQEKTLCAKGATKPEWCKAIER